MDLTDTIIPRSDQLNAEDLLTGPRTFTVAEVKKGSAEQPVDIHLVEFPGRPFRPSKTVRRILVAAWGAEAANYAGRRMTLYRDATVRFGGMDVGGIRVSHLSDIDKPLTLALTVTRGKRAPYVVQPLKEEPTKRARNKRGPNFEALIENVLEARHNGDLDDIARASVGLPADQLAVLKELVTARRAELAEPPAESDGWPDVAPIPGTES